MQDGPRLDDGPGERAAASGEPLVWADDRQSLCETLPYFQAQQSGCYTNQGHAYGFLIDGLGGDREYMDESVIHVRAGGCMGLTEQNSTIRGQTRDQCLTDTQPRTIRTDMELQNPLVVICGSRSEMAPVQMPHRYNVLGWFKPTLVWAERTIGTGGQIRVTVMYRLEWLQGQGSPWFVPRTATKTYPDMNTSALKPIQQACQDCYTSWPRVYAAFWMCLNNLCPSFWKQPNGDLAQPNQLRYEPSFLKSQTCWVSETAPYSVRVPLPRLQDTLGAHLGYINTRGIVCPECGKCNSRTLWSGWYCSNTDCTWEGLAALCQPVTAPTLHTPYSITGEGPTLGRNKHGPEASVAVRYAAGYKVYEYTFHGIHGRFIHASANKKTNDDPLGANEMFYTLQARDIGLARQRFTHQLKKGILSQPRQHLRRTKASVKVGAKQQKYISTTTSTSEETGQGGGERKSLGTYKPSQHIHHTGSLMVAFSVNYGLPYKFIASGATRPWEGAAWPIGRARDHLNWAVQAFDTTRAVKAELNELLVFAYLEGQKMEYHDDGEVGLGPQIATLSLGGAAKMHLRMKAKHFHGCSKSGILTTDRPIPGSRLVKERTAAIGRLKAIRTNEGLEAYTKMRKTLPKELGLLSQRQRMADDVLTVTLNHGDIVIMDGYEIQQFLEHKVVSEGLLRFALTCRTILPGHEGLR